MTSKELREKFLKFFESKGHAIIPSSSLIPENDPTVLFTTAGMHPLVPYLLGEKHPQGKRLTNCQKCIRTGDIDEVGDDTHLTFFEMLGNWSLGDYWKEDAVKWSFEFLTNELKIPLERLAVSCFVGDNDAPKDEESAKIWESLGVKKERIAFLPKDDNWWGPAGQTGPCGPDTEMFYWKLNDKPAPEVFDASDKNWVEIWNDVFMQYVKDENGKYNLATQKNVDTGMGLERTLAVLGGETSVYETDLFLPIIKRIEELSGKKYEERKKEFSVIADHIKAATFMLTERLEPSNVERGYVLRRLIRRAVRYGKQIGINDIFTSKVAEAVMGIYKDVYPEVSNSNFITEQLNKEEEEFEKSEPKREKNAITEMTRIVSKEGYVTGAQMYDIYGTTGVAGPDLMELAKQHNIEVRRPEDYIAGLQRHQELSRIGAEQKFKGGLADHSEQTTKYHTATHLLFAAMRQLLNNEIYQKGSNITAERLRFDFNYPDKLTDDQIKKIEDLVNEKIKEDIPVEIIEMSKEEALKIAKISFDPSKYGDVVKVYKIGDFSIELCGGPHVERTGLLGNFKIIKEESSSAGIRRIKAVLN